ncbi:MAG: RES family NAD+ phosphorylase [Chloroflexota bacterium]
MGARLPRSSSRSSTRFRLPRSLAVYTTAGPWWRIHRIDYSAVYFGHDPETRYGDPRGEYRVLYAAKTVTGAFLETLGHQVGKHPKPGQRPHFLHPRQLADRGLALITSWRTLRLVDVTDRQWHHLGVDGAFMTGPVAGPQRLAQAIWNRKEPFEGIVYSSRLNAGERCVALFDRAADTVLDGDAVELGPLDGPRCAAIIAELMRRYRYRLSS